jgi:hypothetical protein
MQQPVKLTGRIVSEPSSKGQLSFFVSSKGLGNVYCQAAPGWTAQGAKAGDKVVLAGGWIHRSGISETGHSGSEPVFCFRSLDVLAGSSQAS